MEHEVVRIYSLMLLYHDECDLLMVNFASQDCARNLHLCMIVSLGTKPIKVVGQQLKVVHGKKDNKICVAYANAMFS